MENLTLVGRYFEVAVVFVCVCLCVLFSLFGSLPLLLDRDRDTWMFSVRSFMDWGCGTAACIVGSVGTDATLTKLLAYFKDSIICRVGLHKVAVVLAST